MSSFLGLALTGLPLKYHDSPGPGPWRRVMGGFHNTASGTASSASSS